MTLYSTLSCQQFNCQHAIKMHLSKSSCLLQSHISTITSCTCAHHPIMPLNQTISHHRVITFFKLVHKGTSSKVTIFHIMLYLFEKALYVTLQLLANVCFSCTQQCGHHMVYHLNFTTKLSCELDSNTFSSFHNIITLTQTC